MKNIKFYRKPRDSPCYRLQKTPAPANTQANNQQKINIKRILGGLL